MHADVERFSDQPEKQFLRVIQQQGRVALAADGNEQVAILLRYLTALAADVIGPHGTPTGDDPKNPGSGFKIVADGSGNFTIGAGHYWVDGLLCDNPTTIRFRDQPSPFSMALLNSQGQYLAYLDVWERHISTAQDDSIRDVALGGPDTCSRSQLVWQVRLLAIEAVAKLGPDNRDAKWEEWRTELVRAPRARLAAMVDKDAAPANPCQAPPGAGYFGNENQLYRVEIHRGSGEEKDGEKLRPTFKWSRDNGSVVYPLVWVNNTTALLCDPPIDCRKSLSPNVLVEVIDDDSTLSGEPGVMARVVGVEDDGDDIIVQLSAGPTGRIDADRHPILRRWDHPVLAAGANLPATADDGALTVIEGDKIWLTLEDGIKVRFAGSEPPAPAAIYRCGDYWTFPARAATAEITWPSDGASPKKLEPRGITHHYAPLAVLTFAPNRNPEIQDFRHAFAPIAAFPNP
jgi:hypothetical protein